MIKSLITSGRVRGTSGVAKKADNTDRCIVVAGGVYRQRVHAGCRVVPAGGVALKRSFTNGSIGGSFRVAYESERSIGRIEVAGRVA